MQYSALPRSSDWISAKLWGRSGDRHKPYYRETQSSRLSGAACRAAALEVRGVTASPICLGTMQYGEALTFVESSAQMDLAADRGVNFFDTAEMYPVPPRPETQGSSERHLGRWLKTRKREDVLVATKATGPSGAMHWIRDGPDRLDAAAISQAIDGSLMRLGLDHIDIYQLHWPDRYVPMFGDVRYDATRSYTAEPLEAQMEALEAAQHAGKISSVGLSNETAWGLCQFCQRKKDRGEGGLTVATLQNAYSLLCRTFEDALAEVCHQEDVKLLAYSPLAMGLLTGKYLDGRGGPPESRLNKYRARYAEAEKRYGPKPNLKPAVEAYVALAHKWGMAPTEMAMRFVLSSPLVGAAVPGVTSTEQLTELLDAVDKGPLPAELLEAIDEVHERYPSPTP